MLLERAQPTPDPVAVVARDINRVRQTSWYRSTGKRVFDLVGGLVLLVLLAPVMLVLIPLIARDGHSPFFKHERVGRHGRRFNCVKFRTMRPDAEFELEDLINSDPELAAQWAVQQKLDDDPRITGIGKFLRQTSLDELPQLFNVIGGDMSLVGPRPVTEDELFHYGADVHKYLALRPGATGLWQVYGRGRVSYSERVGMDALYHDNHAFGSDLRILGRTVRVVLSFEGQ